MAFSAHKDPEMMEEKEDSPEVLAIKVQKLVGWIRESKHLVVFTGAGVSTSAGIPDFRGPDGVWTLQALGKQRKGPETSTLKAFPTVCHMSLVELQNRGILKYLISQNCDGLHKRSGILPERISELHGNGNIEYCEACGQEYLRDFGAYRLSRGRDHYTGRHCVVPVADSEGDSGGVCNGRLMESTIDFGQNLPERPLELADEHSNKADLHIVFGSSLTVSPACNMPKTTAKKGGRLVIVNLQKTPLYDLATLNIRARCDAVMAALMAKLEIPIPRWALKREIIFHCQANKQECVLSVQGIDPANRTLPASVCKNVKFQVPKIARITKSTILTDKEPFRLRLSYEEAKEEKDKDATIPLTAVFTWRGHYDEPDIPVKLNLPLGTHSTTCVSLSYTPSLEQWDTKSAPVPEVEVKSWSPLMQSLMGSGLVIESKDVYNPEIKNISIHDADEEMKVAEDDGKEEGRRPPGALWSASAVTLDEKKNRTLHIFGGAPISKIKGAMGISSYNIEKKVWRPLRGDKSDLAFVSKERWGHTATVCPEGSSNVYLIGGWDSSCQYGDVFLYDAKADRITELDVSEISPRAGHSAVCVESSIYVFGGALCKGGPYKFYDDLQIFDTEKKFWSEFVVKGAEKPPPRSQHSSVALGDAYLLILGGYTGGSLLDDIWALDFKTARWKRLVVTSEEKGPRGFLGLQQTDFRVRPAAHTSVLLKWSNGVATLLVSGLGGSLDSYLLTVRPALATMQWKKVQSSLQALTGHSYVSFPKPDGNGVTVIAFGGLVNERSGEPGTGRTNSYLRIFDVE